MMGRKPFKAPYTMFDNWVLDVAMPRLSHPAWKVLCVAIRQTIGWEDKKTESGRKERDRISYSQFMRKTGINSRSTVSRALKECLAEEYLLRTQVGTVRGQPLYAYELNTDYEVPDEEERTETTGSAEEPVEDVTGSVEEPVEEMTGSVEEPVEEMTGSVEEPTKERGAKEKQRPRKKEEAERKAATAADLTDEQQKALDLLLTVPRMDPAVAQETVKTCILEHVPGWVAEGLRADPAVAAPLVIKRLQDGIPPPEPDPELDEDSTEARKAKWTQSQYTDMIEH